VLVLVGLLAVAMVLGVSALAVLIDVAQQDEILPPLRAEADDGTRARPR